MSLQVRVRGTIAGLELLLVGLITISTATVVRAQVAGATLSGTITDPSGAAIVGATVSITNKATGVIRQAATDSTGFYSAPNLLPGDYEVTVAASGFSSTKQSDLALTVGAEQVLNHVEPSGRKSPAAGTGGRSALGPARATNALLKPATYANVSKWFSAMYKLCDPPEE